MPIALTVYQGPAGDRNDLGRPGASRIAEALATQLSLSALEYATVGQPRAALNQAWEAELQLASPDFSQLRERLRSVMSDRSSFALTALNRCAAAIATIPAIVEAHPEVAIVWFDAHADLNTPATTSSGYLGGMALSGPTGLWDTGFGGAAKLSHVVLVGSRDLDPCEAALVAEGRVQLIPADHPNLGAELRKRLAGKSVYVHLDCDVLEPGLVPTDFQVPGGLSFARLTEAFEALAGLPVVGLEIAEFQARWSTDGPPGSTADLLRAVQPLLEAVASRR